MWHVCLDGGDVGDYWCGKERVGVGDEERVAASVSAGLRWGYLWMPSLLGAVLSGAHLCDRLGRCEGCAAGSGTDGYEFGAGSSGGGLLVWMLV